MNDAHLLFNQLGLRDELVKAIAAKGYAIPTPIQARAIPVILADRDVLARAQTGTGKTDAFALPLVDILSRHIYAQRVPRALVLTPTRELALQVGECIKAYARTVSLRCTVVYGGINIVPQIERLRRGIDILVATPGRLLDLAEQGEVNLERLEFLVFDEADRMLDLGFSKEITQILNLLPEARRTMLFSATYTQEIRDLAARLLQNPEYIEVTPSTTAAESVTQTAYLVEQADKRALLAHLVTQGKWSRVLVFCRTKHGANRITEKLVEQGFRAAALHGNKSQSLRTRTLEEFRRGDVRILVATDVAARGLDIVHLPFVVNYDMPAIPEDYIHRIGRTGRAGESGLAVSFVSSQETRFLQAIETLLGRKITRDTIAGYTDDAEAPDYILYRPNNAISEKKAPKAIKDLIAQRAARSKKQAKTGGNTARPSGSGRQHTEAGQKDFPASKSGKMRGKQSKAGSSGSQSRLLGKRRGKR